MRNRYAEHLEISPRNLYARSTNVARCLGTMSALLGGFLYSNPNGVVEDEPIVVETMLDSEEYMIPNSWFCKRLEACFREGRYRIDQMIDSGSDGNFIRVKKKLIKFLKPETIIGAKIDQNNFVRIHDVSSAFGSASTFA